MNVISLDWFIPWFPVLVIASHFPAAIRMDLKDREVPHKTWRWMLPMGVATGYLYITGYYPLEMLALSFGFTLLYFAAMKAHIIEGADFMLLMFISLLYIANPISGHYFTQVHVLVWLLALWVIVNFMCYMLHAEIKQFPMIPVIAGAFFMAVILG